MVRKSTIKEGIEVLGIFSMFALSVFAYLVWWLAFHQGGRVTIDVNFAGEMWLEYLLWAIITPLITLSMYYYLEEDEPSESDARRSPAQTDRLSVDRETPGED